MYLTFAWRYFNAKKSTQAINIISWVTSGVIAVSIMSQVLVLSVFNGFEDLVKSLYSNFYTDLKVVPSKGKTLVLTTSQISQLKAFPGIKSVSMEVEEKALLQNGELQTVVYLKGVDSAYNEVSGVPQKMLRGDFQTGSADKPLLILGSGIENAIGVEADKNLSPLTVFLPKKTLPQETDPMSALSEGNANTSGSFAIQQDFDDKYVITNLAFIKQQMNYKANEYTSAEVALDVPAKSDDIKKSLQKALGAGYSIETKYQQNTTLYNSMKLEKWAIFAILTLIQIIAAFNIIGALTMLVLEKRKDINVLQSMGAGRGLVKKIFLSEGVLLAAIGAIAGFLLALIICYLQVKFKLIRLQGNSFLIDYFPVKLVFTDFILVGATAFLIAFIASWFPANKASRQSFELKT